MSLLCHIYIRGKEYSVSFRVHWALIPKQSLEVMLESSRELHFPTMYVCASEESLKSLGYCNTFFRGIRATIFLKSFANPNFTSHNWLREANVYNCNSCKRKVNWRWGSCFLLDSGDSCRIRMIGKQMRVWEIHISRGHIGKNKTNGSR